MPTRYRAGRGCEERCRAGQTQQASSPPGRGIAAAARGRIRRNIVLGREQRVGLELAWCLHRTVLVLHGAVALHGADGNYTPPYQCTVLKMKSMCVVWREIRQRILIGPRMRNIAEARPWAGVATDYELSVLLCIK